MTKLRNCHTDHLIIADNRNEIKTLRKRIAELEAELIKWTSGATIAVCRAENKRLRETIEILKQALEHAQKDKAVF